MIITAGVFAWQDWLDAAPGPVGSKYQKGVPGAGKRMERPFAAFRSNCFPVHPIRYNNQKGVHILGMEYRSMEDTAAAVIADYEAGGW
ncbi:hypothetical protein C8R46DRAFT_1213529 [Mycena filopes]|nr:hypothetical protein C8R46DRAFT_1213529 [Mycena filopes]